MSLGELKLFLEILFAKSTIFELVYVTQSAANIYVNEF